MNNNKLLGVIAVVLLALGGIVGYAFHGSSHSVFGAAADCQSTTCLSGGLSITSGLLQSSGTFQIGSSGTSLTQVLSGTCTLIISAGSTGSTVTASTTKAYDCAVTGVISGDKVFVQAATSTPPAFGTWSISGASASTTSGFITLQVANWTGGNANFPSAIGSSTQYYIVR